MKNKSTTDILFVGVGGQGIVLSSEVLASVCMAAGHEIKQSEVHGMAQRGGSVISHVRFGPEVFSPTVEQGCADFLLAFEMLEALRWIDYLHAGGVALVNTQRLDPITVSSGAAEYPPDVPDRLRETGRPVVLVDGLDIAQKSGNIRAVNVVLLGALSTHLKFDLSLWQEAIRHRVPAKTLQVNLAAFEAGRKAAMNPSISEGE